MKRIIVLFLLAFAALLGFALWAMWEQPVEWDMEPEDPWDL